jgi:hypothetical protein
MSKWAFRAKLIEQFFASLEFLGRELSGIE